MVCQYYQDSNSIWQPRTKSGIYQTQNSSSSSLGSINSLESVMSTNSTVSRRGKRIPGGYPCLEQDCGKVFDLPSDLRHHQRNHTSKDDRPYPCECGERFLYPKDLLRHSRNIHGKRESPATVSLAKERNSASPGLFYPQGSSSESGKKRRTESPPNGRMNGAEALHSEYVVASSQVGYHMQSR